MDEFPFSGSIGFAFDTAEQYQTHCRRLVGDIQDWFADLPAGIARMTVQQNDDVLIRIAPLGNPQALPVGVLITYDDMEMWAGDIDQERYPLPFGASPARTCRAVVAAGLKVTQYRLGNRVMVEGVHLDVGDRTVSHYRSRSLLGCLLPLPATLWKRLLPATVVTFPPYLPGSDPMPGR